ncbi:MAG: 2Fe-2S iron-sulfur cluster binding domain-containing protein [Pseudomonadales bacterium]|nr:2Fe-2S iron-sulfur cluster binding domain-containing protein [Pseudomonadales bacterium]
MTTLSTCDCRDAIAGGIRALPRRFRASDALPRFAGDSRGCPIQFPVWAFDTAVPTIFFVQPDGSREAHRDAVGRTVMDCALDNGVRGIGAQCGGGCTCSTCHGFVDHVWFASVGGPVGDEADILEFTPGRRATSRLTCQIVIRDELDGLVVHVPPAE